MRARNAAVIGVAVALAVGAVAVARRHRPTELRAVDTTVAVRIVRRDRVGLPEKKGVIREPARVRAITEALGVDVHEGGECPPDYADADIGIVLTGNDVYARRNVYVFGLPGDGSGERAPSVVSVTSAGCRVGPPADLSSLRRELRAAGIVE
jgi:hypothetical protein